MVTRDMPPTTLTLTVSLADLDFARTKSVGIFNLSLGLVEQLSRRPELSRPTVLANREHHPQSVSALEQAYFVRRFWGTVRHARVIFTISDFTTGEILRQAKARGLTPPPVHTIGIGFNRPAASPGPRENRIVVLASPFPQKRTALAVDWLTRWQRETVFTGVVDWIGRAPADLNWPTCRNWRRHERLPEADYRALLARARALVFFTDYEGFGMPPVEASLVGACPVFSAVPATREVMGGCGYGFNNRDYESFRVALDSALAVSRAQVAAWAEQLLARHHWGLVTGRIVAGLQAARPQCP